MGAESAKVLAVDQHVRAPAGGGHSAHAHDDDALRQIRRLELGEIQELFSFADSLVRQGLVQNGRVQQKRYRTYFDDALGRVVQRSVPADDYHLAEEIVALA